MWKSPIEGPLSMAGALPLGNQTILVTGTDGGGMGQSLAMDLANGLGSGSLLVCSALAGDDGHREIAEAAAARQIHFELVEADFREEAGVDSLVAQTREICSRNGRPTIDGIANVAGYTLDEELAKLTGASFNSLMFLNVGAPLFLVRGLSDMFRQTSVVLYGSIQSKRVYPNHMAYAITKDAINALARQLAVEYKERARCNSLVIGWCPVKRHFDQLGFDAALEGAKMPIGRLLHPNDVNNLTLYLLSRFAAAITGAELHVTGGNELQPFAGR